MKGVELLLPNLSDYPAWRAMRRAVLFNRVACRCGIAISWKAYERIDEGGISEFQIITILKLAKFLAQAAHYPTWFSVSSLRVAKRSEQLDLKNVFNKSAEPPIS